MQAKGTEAGNKPVGPSFSAENECFIIREEGKLFTRKEKSKQNEEKFKEKKNQCFKNIDSCFREKFWKL